MTVTQKRWLTTREASQRSALSHSAILRQRVSMVFVEFAEVISEKAWREELAEPLIPGA
jgi:hypothetical protein